MYQKILYLCFNLIFCFYASAQESRVLTSIADIERNFKVLQQINVLSANIQSVNIAREHFMKKYLEEFKAKEQLSQNDVDTFRKDLNIVLNSTNTLEPKGNKRNPTSWVPPKEILITLNKQEKKEIEGYFSNFNKEVFPLLKEGIDKKDRSQIIDGLTKWLDIGPTYIEFVQKHIDRLKKQVT